MPAFDGAVLLFVVVAVVVVVVVLLVRSSNKLLLRILADIGDTGDRADCGSIDKILLPFVEFKLSVSGDGVVVIVEVKSKPPSKSSRS